MGNAVSIQNKSQSNQADNKTESQPENTDETRYATTDPLVVIAIDFGTTHSGYAFCLISSPDQILTAKRDGIFGDDRIPTVVLLNPNKTFNSFGNEAQEKYGNLSEQERKGYFYVEHFKMALYRSGKLTRETMIKDINGREINALHVFTETIKFFYELGLKIAKLTYTDFTRKILEPHHLQWIVTIPAIWTDSARQFMREAATAAGIREDRLRLVLEPEAASLFCQETKLRATRDRIEQLPVGHKYILADLGGGTADICVHEIIEDRNLRELYRATGDLGGNNVNTAYVQFIQDLVGINVWKSLVEKHPDIYFDIMKDFERKKKLFSMNTQSITLIAQEALVNIFESQTSESFEAKVRNCPHKDSVTYKEDTGRLTINKSLLETFFRPTVKGILDKIQEILDACNDPELKTLMLMGGFADSPYVREQIKENFPNLSLILHNETCLAVLKGAVLMGFKPRSIVQRRARFTYGFSCNVPFTPGEHPESLKVTRDGKDWCQRVFRKMIEKDQLLQYADTFTRKSYSIAKDMEWKHKERYTSLWRSDRRNPVYCRDEPGEEDCEGVGEIEHRPPPGGWPDYFEGEDQLIVGETEFTMKCINKTTEEEYEAQVDFL